VDSKKGCDCVDEEARRFEMRTTMKNEHKLNCMKMGPAGAKLFAKCGNNGVNQRMAVIQGSSPSFYLLNIPINATINILSTHVSRTGGSNITGPLFAGLHSTVNIHN
jgi:hypothetical protein